jgi:hypothetical protein
MTLYTFIHNLLDVLGLKKSSYLLCDGTVTLITQVRGDHFSSHRIAFHRRKAAISANVNIVSHSQLRQWFVWDAAFSHEEWTETLISSRECVPNHHRTQNLAEEFWDSPVSVWGPSLLIIRRWMKLFIVTEIRDQSSQNRLHWFKVSTGFMSNNKFLESRTT